MFRNLGTGEIGKSAVTGSGIVGIPEEEYREAVRMYHLAIKLDDAYAFSSGLVHALPFCDTILEKIPGDTFENYNNIRAQADLQSPVVSAYGEVTGNVLEYWIGAELMKKIPGVNAAVAKIGNAAGKGTEKALNAAGLAMVDLCGKGAGNLGAKLLTGGAEKIGAAVGRSTVNIVGDLILDTTLDTIPNAAGDAADGLGGKAIAVNAVKNTAENLGYNMLGEGIGSLFHAAGKIKNRGYAATDDAVENATRHLDDVGEGVRAVDDVADATKYVDDVIGGGTDVGNIAKDLDTNNIPNMTKQDIIDSIPDDWNYTEHNGFVHIRDADGNIRIRIDPADKVTNYPHVHVYDSDGNLLNSVGNIVDRKSPDGHIPYKDN